MPTFERAYIEQELKNIDGNLPAPISLYIIGGGAMSFYDLKTATKDIDVIVTNEKSATTLLTALQKSGYKKIEHVTSVYRRMKTRAVIENNDGFRWDVFANTVCGGLSLSDGMVARAQPFKKLNNITISLVAPEDIFIFKAVTSRPRDREDMFILFSHGLDMNIIKEEIKRQAKLDESTAWLSFFFVGLDELIEEYHVIIPRYDEFLQMAENEMTERLILAFLQKKSRTLHELATLLQCEEKDIIESLMVLQTQRFIQEKNGKFYRKRINHDLSSGQIDSNHNLSPTALNNYDSLINDR
ncbi:MAG: nucleotidyltransferase [Thermoplasmata archaeon]|nr:nucleotidyltransferase [Thermoplasmata archaeon]